MTLNYGGYLRAKHPPKEGKLIPTDIQNSNSGYTRQVTYFETITILNITTDKSAFL